MGKTAVIIIHGVGEQAPMTTVTGFTRLVAGKEVRSKFYRKSKLFELRRLSTFVDDPKNIPELKRLFNEQQNLTGYPASTTFYEFYWAYHYRDTTITQVATWSVATLLRLIRSRQLWMVRRSVKYILANVLLLLAVAAMLIFYGIWRLKRHGDVAIGGLSIGAGTVLSVFLTFAKPYLLGWAGDAARYFGKSPDNPIERQLLLEEGIKLLRDLNEDQYQKFENIVVVGHSLGSVIAYDMIRNYWNEVNRKISIRDDIPELEEIQKLAKKHSTPPDRDDWSAPPDPPTAEEYQRLQKEFLSTLDYPRVEKPDRTGTKSASTIAVVGEDWTDVRDVWKVRDFITLGSPLAYARTLLAQDASDLFSRQEQRELPTCPPTSDKYPDETGRISFVYTFEEDIPKGHVVPDQTAPFLLTRWTNIYFSQDPIGGPLRPIFGWGINDVQLDYRPSPKGDRNCCAQRTIQDLFGAAHVRYWQLLWDDPKNPVCPKCAAKLRDIIGGGKLPIERPSVNAPSATPSPAESPSATPQSPVESSDSSPPAQPCE
jgi:hypothetical protein